MSKQIMNNKKSKISDSSEYSDELADHDSLDIDRIIPHKKLKDNNVHRLHVTKINNSYNCNQYGTFSIMTMNKNNYINASQLCKEAKKEFKHWKANAISIELMKELSLVIKLPINELIHMVAGGKNTDIRGTYVHPKLIIHVAIWCGPNFAIKISEWIDEWRLFSYNNELRFYDGLSTIVPTTNILKEKEIQTMLHKKLGGEIEVKTSVGRIDLLTDELLIEIKNYIDWKCAVGQLMMYSLEYDDRKKVMYLFNVPEKNIMREISKKCKIYDIIVKVIH